MRKTLLQPIEVPIYAGLKLPFAPCEFRHVLNHELWEFRKCLGAGLRGDMLTAAADYAPAPVWAPGGTGVAVDAVVSHQCIYYQKTDGTINPQPPAKEAWKTAPNFSGSGAAAYEEAWCSFLAEYLSLSILAARLPFIAQQIFDIGVLEYNGNGYRTASDLEPLKTAMYAQRTRVLSNFEWWVQDTWPANKTFFAKWSKAPEDITVDNPTACGCGCKGVTGCLKTTAYGEYRFG